MTKLKPSSINRELSRLRHMLNMAVSWELLDESPMAGIKFQRENNARTRYLSIEECQRLVGSCIAPHTRAIVTVALHSGMRLGEILSLRWYDLDFQANFILVRDSKNGQARHVPMDATIMELLSAHGRRLGSNFVFPSKNGGRLTDIKVGFRNARARAGITDLHFHDLRHTFASHFMMAGGEIYTLQQILGHKTASMTARYSHLSPAYKVKAIDRMNTVWQRNLPLPSAPERLPEPFLVTTASQPILSPAPTSYEPFPGAGLNTSAAGAPAD
jgi:integrase